METETIFDENILFDEDNSDDFETVSDDVLIESEEIETNLIYEIYDIVSTLPSGDDIKDIVNDSILENKSVEFDVVESGSETETTENILVSKIYDELQNSNEMNKFSFGILGVIAGLLIVILFVKKWGR